MSNIESQPALDALEPPGASPLLQLQSLLEFFLAIMRWHVHFSRIGIEPVFQDGGGGSDANIFNALGIPSVLIGVGFEDVHSPSEKITTGDMALAAEFVASLIQTAANPED